MWIGSCGGGVNDGVVGGGWGSMDGGCVVCGNLLGW